MTEKPKSEVPKHLRPATRRWYEEIASAFILESHHEKLLLLCCESWDMHLEARELLAKDGLTMTDRYSTIRAHPAVAMERDAKAQFLRFLRELNLDVSHPQESRPPELRRR